MVPNQRRCSKEEIARRGMEIYNRDIKPQVERDHPGKIVLVDVETGAWEIDADERAAAHRLAVRVPEGQVLMVRVGSPYVRRFGRGLSIKQP
jgi:hypothetical protein